MAGDGTYLAVLLLKEWEHLGGPAVEHLPSAQGVTLGSWDRVPPAGNLLLPLPVSLPVSLSHE